MYISVCQFMHSSVYLSISLFLQFVHLTDSSILSLYLYLSIYFCIQFICLSFCYIFINPLSPSICLCQSLHLSICFSVFHPLVCQSPFSMSVSIHPNCFFHIFKIEHKIRQAQGFCFMNKSLMH